MVDFHRVAGGVSDKDKIGMCPVSVSSHEANWYSGNQKNSIWSVRNLSDRITETLHEVKNVAKRHKTLAVCAAIVAVVAVAGLVVSAILAGAMVFPVIIAAGAGTVTVAALIAIEIKFDKSRIGRNGDRFSERSGRLMRRNEINEDNTNINVNMISSIFDSMKKIVVELDAVTEENNKEKISSVKKQLQCGILKMLEGLPRCDISEEKRTKLTNEVQNISLNLGELMEHYSDDKKNEIVAGLRKLIDVAN